MIERTGIKPVVFLLGGLVAALALPLGALAEWHIVQPGDTLWAIGEEYGVDASEIAEANDVADHNLIVVGQELWIPGTGDDQTGGEPVSYVVQPGDTLASIANGYGIDVNLLVTTNGIEFPYTIYPGQELVIPYAELPVEPTPPSASPPGNIDPSVPFYDRATIRDAVVTLAVAYGWDPYLILALAWQESTWDQRALSPSGAVGVMQLMPTTAEWAGPALVGREVDYVNSAWDNVETGIAYLTHLRAITGSDYLALAAYFQGSGSVERDGIFPTTRAYALGIIESRDLFANGALP